MHLSFSPVADVLCETGLLLVGASGQYRPPRCAQEAVAGESAPSRFAPLHCLDVLLPDPQQAQNVPGSAIENLRCLLSNKDYTYYFVNNISATTPERPFIYLCL